MSVQARQLKHWIDQITKDNPNAEVGVDEGGLTLIVENSSAYYEIGGMSEESGDSNDNTYKKYRVIVTRDATESTILNVMARDEAEAEEQAYEMAGRYGDDVEGWELDEGNNHEIYITDVEKITEEEA